MIAPSGGLAADLPAREARPRRDPEDSGELVPVLPASAASLRRPRGLEEWAATRAASLTTRPRAVQDDWLIPDLNRDIVIFKPEEIDRAAEDVQAMLAG